MRLKVIFLILICCLGVWSGLTYAQQSYPGAAYFSYQCQSDGITFYYQHSPVIHTSFPQITQALSSAASTQRNRLIAATREISLWALKSNELQIHLNHDSEGTKLVFPANICGLPSAGAVSPPAVVVSSQAAVFAQSDVNGEAVAIAVISPTGEIVVYAQTNGGGTAFAFAQTNITNNNTGSIYVVQQGDTLYSIARRNNTTVALLVQLNNLADPDRISVGQRIQLP